MNKHCNPLEWQFGCLVISDEVRSDIVSGNMSYHFASGIVDLVVEIADGAIIKASINE